MDKDKLDFVELEQVYERLADALDEVGQDKADIFLAKIVMLLARDVGDLGKVTEAIASAKADLGER